MALKDIQFEPWYNSKEHNLIEEFYIPALSNAREYKRVSAFFDSNILGLYSVGIENIIATKGHVSFIFSSELKPDDFELMKKGYELRDELKQKLLEAVTTPTPSVELSNLAYLIANNYVDIKIAFTKSGILHDKFGLMIDGKDVLYFRGSNNETVAAIQNNFESFETSCSWDCDAKEDTKIRKAIEEFDLLWNDRYQDTVVVDIPDVVKDKIVSYNQGKLILNFETKENTFTFDLTEDEHLIGFNNLRRPELLTSASLWFDGNISYYVTNNPDINHREYLFRHELSYLQMKKLIALISQRGLEKDFNVYSTPRVRRFLLDNDIKAEKRRSLGIAIKRRDSLVMEEFKEFCSLIEPLMERKLREPQLWDAFHIAMMVRSANFSVPGAGKTSIVYGAYAYLLAKGLVNKIVMIGPINSFMAWKNEFVANFGDKQELRVYDYHQHHYTNAANRYDGIREDTKGCNLVLFNYESIDKNFDAIKSIIDAKTMLVFDEVHRIKSTDGVRAVASLGVSIKANYKVVLTGTPIPNGFKDIYNFLHILFPNEYDILFNFDETFLQSANDNDDCRNQVNRALYPFFCRTTKKDLNVPEPEPDDIETGCCSFDDDYERLLEIVYNRCDFSILLLYIRLMQVSTNPKLLLNKISKEDLHSFDAESESDEFTKLCELMGVEKEEEKYTPEEIKFIQQFDMTEKFYRGLNLVSKIVDEGNQVVVWEIFVDTIAKTRQALLDRGIKCEVIYGKTPLDEREDIIRRFINKEFDVLITNPHTLAESVSLHKNCHHAIYMEYSFNLVHMLQSRDRIHRLGLAQDEKTYYYYMMMDNDCAIFNTIDRKIYERLKIKEDIQKSAVENDDLVYTPDTFKQDIEELLRK